MKVGDLVQYVRDVPASFVEFHKSVRQHDVGLITDALANGTTVRVKWLRNNDEFWMGKNHLEVISGRQKTESD